ncbi:hypothetical protein FM104_12035 [Microbacterium esteraromaticum]|uniref:Uncharacterized protein n=1 Tax=Microbacterium esteraromaticum TaxID=57043 RepID=A0A1R4KE24_9MICO|nr:hypothetical protein [Microbacterium esteraromaticum]SJN42546.1 hypothetical protein FM104_12035 [Microbacterium esteraromaticum]
MAGIVPIAAVATVVAGGVAVGLTTGIVRTIVVVVVLVIGTAGGFLWAARGGAEAMHRRVAGARAEWAQTRRDATWEPDGLADSRDLSLALPSGWRVEAARGRVHFDTDGVAVHAETWVLRAANGSRRAPRRREVVRTAARTGDARWWVPLGAAADSMFVVPRWAGEQAAPEPSWMPAARERVAQHDDLLAALTIGDDRVILLALDDPRPETMVARAKLVCDVAALIR